MDYKDYYKVMGVSPNATEEELRTLYKKLALQYHPDRNPGDKKAEARFKEISEAKEILLDKDNRQKYDKLRSDYLRFQQYQRATTGRRPSGPRPPQGEEEFGSVFGNFWQEVFGGGKRGAKRGKNYDANIKISLAEAYKGLSTILTFEGRRLRIKVRPGIQDGQILKIKGQGQAGANGGPPGDLYLKVMIQDQGEYKRKGNHLLRSVHVPITAAVLGRKVQVETFKGKMSITIPPGTQNGEQLKLKGLGMPIYEDPGFFGDLFVKVKIIVPRRLNEEEKALFKELEKRGL
ncbi:MAG: DnaJ C-terminal domain-containing protein [Bacteroidota bacterium]